MGRICLALSPGLRERLIAGEQPRDRWQRFALQAIVHGMERKGNTEGIARLQQHYWAAADVVAYHDGVDDRFDSMFLKAHQAIVEQLTTAARNAGCTTLCEIGCGSGRVLAHFAASAPDLERLVGIDLSPQQVALNGQRHLDPRLAFVAADAVEWIRTNGRSHWSYLSYGGVLEYLPQERLNGLLRTVAGRSPVVFGLVEPLASSFDVDRATMSQHYGAERSLSHPYPKAFRDAGFEITWQEESLVDGHRFLMLVARA